MLQFPSKFFFADDIQKIEKKPVFRPKIGQNLAKISKIFGYDKNPINALFDQFVGHLGHFWRKNGNFWPFLGLFWPI